MVNFFFGTFNDAATTVLLASVLVFVVAYVGSGEQRLDALGREHDVLVDAAPLLLLVQPLLARRAPAAAQAPAEQPPPPRH